MSFPSPTKTYHQKAYAAIDPTRPELSTKGKHAFISGGGAGIGASIAVSLAKSGVSTLGLLGRTIASLESTKSVIEALGSSTVVHLYVADVTDAEATSSALNSFSHSINGRIDILIANAGYMSDLRTITDSDPEDWWRAFEVTVRGNFNLLRAFQPLAASDSSVIHISTAAIHIPYMFGFSAYRASKSAATKLFEYYHHENPDAFVLQVHPGLIGGTAMSEKFAASAKELGLVYDDIEMSGNFTVWAVSDEAKFLNGRFVHANWDVEELKALKKELENDESRFTIGLQGWF
ncbi:short chain dehydrogenase reductase [Colletotrichum truncatum]|uniref:Short chain dehydrogenase reductase n=1 Tax=Colletotrichum truncatum TaxID=5467 RepID=A0ACC3YWM2_COLTU|nr:short chain dehydrogenase reductase [Colletotrichum truncatum]KAF6787512.1 short chain dehydrogenase reductase [Colletotrichum truncatum]